VNLSDLSKEQRLYLLIGGIAAAVLVGAIVFLIHFNRSVVSDERMILDALLGKIRGAERELARRSLIRTDFDKTVVSLRDYLEKVPPARNYYSWATEAIYVSARAVGLEVASIEEVKNTDSLKDKKVIHLEAYSLRITAHGSYETVKKFINDLEEHQPLVRFSGLEISARSEPDEHDVRLSVQWPLSFRKFALLEDIGPKGRPVAPVVSEASGDLARHSVSSVASVVEALVPAKAPLVRDGGPEPLSLQDPVSLHGQEQGKVGGTQAVDDRGAESESVPIMAGTEDSVSVKSVLESSVDLVGASSRGPDRRGGADGKLISLLENQAPEFDDALDLFFDDFVEDIDEK